MNIAKEVAALRRMTVQELRARYSEVFDESTRARHKQWLIKRIAWRLQAQVEGDLSERARRRAAQLANDADLRLSPPKPAPPPARTATHPIKGDRRLPLPGTIITREYKGETLQIEVLSKGFQFEGETFKSLSAVAKAITGQHCNGFHFFRLGKETSK
jgi:DUF2924 family protein